MNRHDFLVEIGAEEMPPKSLAALGDVVPRRRRRRPAGRGPVLCHRAGLLHAAPPGREGDEAPRPPAGAARRAPRPAGFGRFRRRRQADARRDRLRRLLRRHGGGAHAAQRQQGRVPLLPHDARGSAGCQPPPGHRPGRARCAADRAAHALGRRHGAVRAARSLGRHAARRPGDRRRDPRHRRRAHDARPPLPREKADRAALPGRVPRRAREGPCARRFRGAARAHPGRRRRRGGGRGRRSRHRSRGARRGDRAHRMAGSARGRVRAALPRAAARGAGGDDAGPPALFPGARPGRQADVPLHRGREPREQGPRAGSRRQRAGGAPAARGCRVFLRGRPQGEPRIAPRVPRRRHLPGPARLARRQSRPRHRPRRPDRARRGPGRGEGATRRGTRQVRPRDRHGRGVPGAAGRDGPLLRPPRRRIAGGRHRDRGAVPAPFRRRRPAVDRRRARARHRRQARHDRRHLRHRPEADGHQGPVWPAPRCARRAADPDRDRRRARPARADPRRARFGPGRHRPPGRQVASPRAWPRRSTTT